MPAARLAGSRTGVYVSRWSADYRPCCGTPACTIRTGRSARNRWHGGGFRVAPHRPARAQHGAQRDVRDRTARGAPRVPVEPAALAEVRRVGRPDDAPHIQPAGRFVPLPGYP